MLKRFSIGFKSGLFPGQSSLFIKFGRFWRHQSCVSLEVLAGALSCWNVNRLLFTTILLVVASLVLFDLFNKGLTSFNHVDHLSLGHNMDCWKCTCWHCPPDIYIRTLFNRFGNRNFIFLASPNNVIFFIIFFCQSDLDPPWRQFLDPRMLLSFLVDCWRLYLDFSRVVRILLEILEGLPLPFFLSNVPFSPCFDHFWTKKLDFPMSWAESFTEYPCFINICYCHKVKHIPFDNTTYILETVRTETSER